MRKIAILGSGHEAAVTAAFLGHRLADAFEIVWHRETAAPSNGIVAMGPGIKEMLSSLEMSESDLIAKGGGFLLGSAIALPDRPPFFSGFAAYPSQLDGVPFYHALVKVRGRGAPPAPQHYNMAAVMAGAGRFAHPSGDETDLQGLYSYGLCARSDVVIDAFSEVASARGVQIVEGAHAESDFVIDTRPANDIDGWIAYCDAKIATEQSTSDGPPAPYVFTRVHDASIETIGFDRNGKHHTIVRPAAEGETFGRLDALWTGNRICLGSAASRLPAMFTMRFDLLVQQLKLFARLAPATDEANAERSEYNRQMAKQIDRAFDCTALLLPDAFAPHISPELDRKRDVFRYRGTVPLEDGEFLSEIQWVALLDFLYGAPEITDIRARRLPDQAVVNTLRQQRSEMERLASSAPTLQSVLDDYRK